MTHEPPLNGGSGGSRPHLSWPRSHHNRRLSPQAVALLGLVLAGSVWALHRNRSDVGAGAAAADADVAERQYKRSRRCHAGGGGGCAARWGLDVGTAALASLPDTPQTRLCLHMTSGWGSFAACLSRFVAYCCTCVCAIASVAGTTEVSRRRYSRGGRSCSDRNPLMAAWQMAGALWGVSAIPERWRAGLACQDTVHRVCGDLGRASCERARSHVHVHERIAVEGAPCPRFCGIQPPQTLVGICVA